MGKDGRHWHCGTDEAEDLSGRTRQNADSIEQGSEWFTSLSPVYFRSPETSSVPHSKDGNLGSVRLYFCFDL